MRSRVLKLPVSGHGAKAGADHKAAKSRRRNPAEARPTDNGDRKGTGPLFMKVRRTRGARKDSASGAPRVEEVILPRGVRKGLAVESDAGNP